MSEQGESFLNDPFKTAAVITAGMLATFSIMREVVPPSSQHLVEIIGVSDFILNAVTLGIIRNKAKINSL